MAGINKSNGYGAGNLNDWKSKKFAEGKSCDNCIHNDRCPYDHNPGKSYICWKRDPRAKSS